MRVQRKTKLGSGAVFAAACLVLALAGGCSGSSLVGASPEAEKPAPPAPPPQAEPAPPPIDMAGRWRLAGATGGGCFMTFGIAAGTAASAAQGTIAPEGGCPGNFYTSRKWAFEDGALIIRDFKGQTLARLAYSGDHFQGDDATGALTLARPAAR
jgi:Protease inhibitor Inh